MRAKDFAIQSTIKDLRTDDGNYCQKGMVIGNDFPDGDMTIAVEWEDGKLEKVSVDDVDLVNSELERDFLTIKEKIDQASALVTEAIAMAEKHGTSLRNMSYDHDLDISVLNSFVENSDSGWDSSQKCW